MSHLSFANNSDSQECPPFRVLSLDGGGVRGVCSAVYLSELEKQVGSPLHQYFDLICGTSAGGIIAISLALEIPMDRVLDMFQNKADEVFNRKLPGKNKFCAMLADVLYSNEPFHSNLQDLVGAKSKIGDAKCRLCIPAVNMTTGKAVVFKTRHDTYLKYDYLLPAWKVAAATSAAPIYFKPVTIPGRGKFVDGGLWANTPASIGILEGLRLKKSLDDIELLAIGTGSSTFQRSADHGKGILSRIIQKRKDGLMGWNTDLVKLTMNVQTDREENFMKFMLEDRYCRVQFPLPQVGFELDSVHDVEALSEIAFEEAKCSVHEISQRFLTTKATPFTPEPF
ncbi:MAG: patatin-like phospholipase family protein [Rhodothermaceae bacterium]|nr:patatin-like phospholipase family protein [Rhodothermaceae bacterium]MYD67707.1 patatin-like phospholipase family protein [Rhodothermaceae bacterium]MYJ06363.1 patatin-like phospholipase family protein [Rhodothermaceae bacterium]